MCGATSGVLPKTPRPVMNPATRKSTEEDKMLFSAISDTRTAMSKVTAKTRSKVMAADLSSDSVGSGFVRRMDTDLKLPASCRTAWLCARDLDIEMQLFQRPAMLNKYERKQP